ncbi:MAG TPA: hypothetical protein VJZ71_16265 [Phycisphaerae bacterium]|nr:hypothetical protein [Phycisphaerae bacterium]
MKKRRPFLRFSKWFALSMLIATIGACTVSVDTAYVLDTPCGRIRLIYSALEFSKEGPEQFGWSTEDDLSSKENGLLYWGFHKLRSRVIVPLSFPGALLLIATPLLWWIDRKRKHKVDTCEFCGYDISAQTLPRCPECGNSFDPSLLKVNN